MIVDFLSETAAAAAFDVDSDFPKTDTHSGLSVFQTGLQMLALVFQGRESLPSPKSYLSYLQGGGIHFELTDLWNHC